MTQMIKGHFMKGFNRAISLPLILVIQRLVRWVALAVLLIGVLTGCLAEDNAQSSQKKPDPVATPVEVITLQSESVTLTTKLPAQVMPYLIAEVRPQVDGIVVERLMGDSLEVSKGQPLYQIDPRRYEAAVNNARAELKKTEANLTAVRVTEKRFQNLIGTQAVSQQQYDDVKALLQQREAEVDVALAALETAQVNLQYTRVTAPISGRIEQFMVTEGALVEELQLQTMATIRQLDPVYIDMYQDANALIALRKDILDGQLKTEKTKRLDLFFADGSRYPHSGEVLYSELNVNANTGSVLVRALIPNPNRLLMPGQFVTAIIDEGVNENAVLVPQRAVTYNRQGMAEVMLVTDENKVERRALTLGQAIENRLLVKTGLAAGDRVIVAGLQKVRPGDLASPVEASAEKLEVR